MTTCEFLIKDMTKACAGCRGWFCTSTGRRKKLSKISICKDDHLDCVRYLAAHPELGEEIVSVSIEEPEEKSEEQPEPTPEPEPEEEQPDPEPEVEVEPEPEVIELSPTEEVTTISGVNTDPIKIVIPPPRLTQCPYLGPIPEGKTGCCGYWCYAVDKSQNVVSSCKSRPSWRECLRRYKAKQRGVKYAST